MVSIGSWWPIAHHWWESLKPWLPKTYQSFETWRLDLCSSIYADPLRLGRISAWLPCSFQLWLPRWISLRLQMKRFKLNPNHPVLRGAHRHLLSHLWAHPHLWVVVLSSLWHVLHRAGKLHAIIYYISYRGHCCFQVSLNHISPWLGGGEAPEQGATSPPSVPECKVYFGQLGEHYFKPAGLAQSSQLISRSRVSPVPGEKFEEVLWSVMLMMNHFRRPPRKNPSLIMTWISQHR